MKKPNLTLSDLNEYDHDKNVFGEWKSNIIQKADSIIHHLSRRLIQIQQYFTRNHPETTFKDLHSKYVIDPINKETCKKAFICHEFYDHFLVKELGLLNNNNNINQLTKKFLILILT